MLNFGNEVCLKDDLTFEKSVQILKDLKSFDEKLDKIPVSKSRLDFGVSTENLVNISKEAFGEINKEFERQKANLIYLLETLKKFFDGTTRAKNRQPVDDYKQNGIVLPLKSAKQFKYVTDISLKGNRLEIHEVRQKIDSNLKELKNLSFKQNQDFNKVKQALAKYRDFAAVMLKIKRYIEKDYKSEHKTIVPPARKAGKFTAERSDHSYMVNGPVKITGMS